MPKINDTKKSVKLYHGTTALMAKNACVKGLSPYDLKILNGVPNNIFNPNSAGISLTSLYPGLMSFDVCNDREKWGIMEIDMQNLLPECFLPHESFLLEKTKVTSEDDKNKKLDQLRLSLSGNRRRWKESLDDFGVCLYEKDIPLSAITKVAIYDPFSNPTMTKAMINISVNSKINKANVHRQEMVIRWLMGENITPEKWLGSDVFAKMAFPDKDKVGQVLRNKSGLDIFYSGGPTKKSSGV